MQFFCYYVIIKLSNYLLLPNDNKFLCYYHCIIITHSSSKKLKLPFRKTKLGIQSLSYVGPNTWNSLPNNLKSATSVNSFKHYIKECFLKKLGNVEADIYSYT